MDWTNRPNKPASSAGQAESFTNGAGSSDYPNEPRQDSRRNRSKRSGRLGSFQSITSITMLISVAILVAAFVGYLVFYRGTSESDYVSSDKMQAVFLNGGQVYFGKIRALNSKYVNLSDIYYLRVNQQVQPKQGEQQAKQEISLAKLGCELHGPQDRMIINRDQIVFWENLKSDGKVAKAVDEFRKANPNGQKCEDSQPASPSGSNDQAPKQQDNAGQSQPRQ